MLNRAVKVAYDEASRKYVEIEPDARPAELIVQALGLDMKKTNGVMIPSLRTAMYSNIGRRQRLVARTSRRSEVV